jgi:uncharacterized protein (UPF0335 family)
MNAYHTQRDRGGFGGRIILIVIAVIALSQVLGTFLNVLSFEKFYLEALTSKYEILGKDLKRKIELALKIGKPLDRLLGVDGLVAPLFQQSDDLNEIFILDNNGRILFTFEKVEFVVAKGAVDEEEYPRGKVLLGYSDTKKTYPAGALMENKGKGSVLRLYQNKYYIMFPIIPRFGGRKGTLGLVFSKSVLEGKKREMIRSARNKLGIAVVATAIVVGFMIRFLFIAAARRRVDSITSSIDDPRFIEDSGDRDVPEEVLDVQLRIADYMSQTEHVKQELSKSLDELQPQTRENATVGHDIEVMKRILQRKEDDEI